MQKTILITGASSGIGNETAKLLLKHGHTVIATARRIEKMKNLAELGADTLLMDVTDDASMEQAISEIIKKHGRIDVLVNNAGYGSYGAVEEVSGEEVRRQFEVNVFGIGKLIQLVTPLMRKQTSGTIINISSVAGKVYMPFGAWYHSTKHAVEGLTDSLRVELAPYGIKVVLIEPGLIKSEWSGISLDNLIKNSANGPYKNEAENFARILESSYKGNNPSKPVVIAKTILKAITSNKPKTRYRAGKMSTYMVLMRWLLSDKLFDQALKFEMKKRT